MRKGVGAAIGIGILTLAFVLSMPPVTAHGWEYSCSQVLLQDSSGVIGTHQHYTFKGSCEWNALEETGTSVGVGFKSSSVNHVIAFNFAGTGSWNRTTGEAKEQLKIEGSGDKGYFSGIRVATGICSPDPFLKDPPGGPGSCNNMNVIYQSSGGAIFDLLTQKTFFLAKRVSLVEAEALSAKHPSSNPASAPPPKPNPKPGVTLHTVKKILPIKPNLVIVYSQAIVEANCQPPKPAMIVKLTIKNTGGAALPAHAGTVSVKESGGSSLAGGPVSLPALGAGMQWTATLPVTSPHLYSSLSGHHLLKVQFLQVMRGSPSFHHPSPPYTVDAVFPAGHCTVKAVPHVVPPAPAGTRRIQSR
jgi:hypothetical protein